MPAERARVRALAGAIAAAGLGVLASMLPAPPSWSARPCVQPVRIDGRLHCEGEVELALARACPGVRIDVRGGDRIDTSGCRSSDGSAGVRDAASGAAQRRMAPDELEILGVVLDLNTASIDDLSSLPGVGPVLAARMVEGRPYAHVDDVERVRGIGPRTLGRIRARIHVAAP